MTTMFKSLIILSVVAVIVLSKPEDSKYTTKYDNIDLDAILENNRLLDTYLKCLKDKGPCTPDGKELRDNLEEALQNECKKCNEKQKEGTRKVIRYLSEHKKDDWEELKKKYDPEGKYQEKYKDLSQKEQIKV